MSLDIYVFKFWTNKIYSFFCEQKNVHNKLQKLFISSPTTFNNRILFQMKPN